ncbi:hypothetical protein Tsubulata_029640 [Turnera subulata]|uniref:Uncharacterized protein n=1 Tax=Turnera subulata TaxID=218843 RepID=A0A9Q0FMH9_9ROSI|nr:hypothetical protein Tsubulata_029640 [Turnera subulata]
MARPHPDWYTSRVEKSRSFTAYDYTFEPRCRDYWVNRDADHMFHTPGTKVENVSNDLLLGIWEILHRQALWLERKLPSARGDHTLSLADLNRQTLTQEMKDAVRTAVSEALKGGSSQPQLGDFEKHMQALKDMVTQASKEIGDQNTEMLNKLSGVKQDMELALKDQRLDDKFGHTEKVIRDCLADVEIRISNLQRLGRNILAQVSDSSGITGMEKLVLENNKILKNLEAGDLKIPGLEQLVRAELESIKDIKTIVRRVELKQEKVIEKLEEQQQILKNPDIIELIVRNDKEEIEKALKEISTKLDRGSLDLSIADELAKAKEILIKLSQS